MLCRTSTAQANATESTCHSSLFPCLASLLSLSLLLLLCGDGRVVGCALRLGFDSPGAHWAQGDMGEPLPPRCPFLQGSRQPVIAVQEHASMEG
jgi:hypothetical protein